MVLSLSVKLKLPSWLKNFSFRSRWWQDLFFPSTIVGSSKPNVSLTTLQLRRKTHHSVTFPVSNHRYQDTRYRLYYRVNNLVNFRKKWNLTVYTTLCHHGRRYDLYFMSWPVSSSSALSFEFIASTIFPFQTEHGCFPCILLNESYVSRFILYIRVNDIDSRFLLHWVLCNHFVLDF